MAPKIIIYLVSLLCVTFAITGINFDHFFKTKHIWEARFFIAIIIISLSYLVTNFTLDIMDIIKTSIGS